MRHECSHRRTASGEYECPRCRARWDADEPTPPCPLDVAAEGAPPKLRRPPLDERLVVALARLRAASILPSVCDEVEDMIVEVKLLMDEVAQLRASAEARPVIVPFRRDR